MRFADYVYANHDDTRRVRIFRVGDDRRMAGWDYDVFRRWPAGGWDVQSARLADAGEMLALRRRDAVKCGEDEVGALHLIKVRAVTEGWPEKPPPKVTEDAAIEIREGQIWRHGTRKLVVDWVAPNWRDKDKRDVGCHFVQASGREVGTQIRGRRSARQSYGEQRFREKFRFVREPDQEG